MRCIELGRNEMPARRHSQEESLKIQNSYKSMFEILRSALNNKQKHFFRQ